MNAPLDPLSAAARSILKMNVTEAYTKLVVTAPGDSRALAQLKQLTSDNVLASAPANPDEAKALLAGLWLWHDGLDESHRLSQQLQTTSGSMWHAIMHRREGDFSNSKYWYARCRNHPCLTTLAAAANEMINPFPADTGVLKITLRGWDADAFVELVSEVYDTPGDPRHALAVALQQLEWRTLFDSCLRAAR